MEHASWTVPLINVNKHSQKNPSVDWRNLRRESFQTTDSFMVDLGWQCQLDITVYLDTSKDLVFEPVSRNFKKRNNLPCDLCSSGCSTRHSSAFKWWFPEDFPCFFGFFRLQLPSFVIVNDTFSLFMSYLRFLFD